MILINICFVQCRRLGSTEEEFKAGVQPDRETYLDYGSNEEMGESRGVLRFTNVSRSDDGLYECVAQNSGGSASKIGHVTVEYAPNFKLMESLPPVYGWDEIANLSCFADGEIEIQIE